MGTAGASGGGGWTPPTMRIEPRKEIRLCPATNGELCRDFPPLNRFAARTPTTTPDPSDVLDK